MADADTPFLLGTIRVVGSQFDVRETVVTVSANGQQIVAEDGDRIYIQFSVVGATVSLTISTRPGVTINDGILLTTTIPQQFVFGQSGPLPSKAWYAASSPLNGIITVLEVLLRRPGP